MPICSPKPYFHFFLLILLSGQFFCIPNTAFTEEELGRESTIKAGFLLKFSEFIQWPEYYSSLYSEEPLNICLHGKDEFGDIFDYVNDHDILRREILVRRFVPLIELKSCHLVFISNLEIEDVDNITKEVKKYPVLVVTNNQKISHSLVAINFREINNQIRFEINLSAFERSGIKIGSELLNLAINVVRID